MHYACCPIHVVLIDLISNLVTDYIQKRRGEPGLFSFEHICTTWIGHVTMTMTMKKKKDTKSVLKGHQASEPTSFQSDIGNLPIQN